MSAKPKSAAPPPIDLSALPAIVEMAESYGLTPTAFAETFRAVAMPTAHSDAEFISCCLIARELGLNFLTREVRFLRDPDGEVRPIVAVDGWIRLCNQHPQYDGMEISDVKDDKGNIMEMTVAIYRKDRGRPTVITEYMDECARGGGEIWARMPKRQLRHRTICQGARIAFGFSGIMELDEFRQWQAQSGTSRAAGRTDTLRPIGTPATIPPVLADVGIPSIDDPPLDQNPDDIPVIDASADVAPEAATLDKPEPDVVAGILDEIEHTTWSSLVELLEANGEAMTAMSTAGKTRIEEAILGKMIKTWSAAKGIRAKESVAEGFDSLLDRLSDPIRRTAEAVFEGRKVAP